MSAPARLLSVRLQGFKSFADRTHVEFGPGISAIVGPNGSGKSNLADALRWALGEQGRALRARKSEDVVWAGSEKRPAVGMADVQLTLDNGDALLPVEFGVVELGRRLYRSGENDYLLNRQRVRLRDLVELLDAGHLAENAFLFIGQGMVDQALALRPEERRSLFEEVAGVRRHERRRRRAEEQLAESAANLARVDDILAELRPQARRLAQQAEQQANRQTAADELAAAILASAHARWHEAGARSGAAQAAMAAARAQVAAAAAELASHEQAMAAARAALDGQARAEAEVRATLDRARAERAALQLREARHASEVEAAARERASLERAREAAGAEEAAARQVLSLPQAVAPRDLEQELAALDAEISAGGLTRRPGDSGLSSIEVDAIRRLEAARAQDVANARRRATEALRAAEDEAQRSSAAAAQAEAARVARAAAASALGSARAEDESARREREALQAALAELETAARAATDAAAGARSAAAAAAARHEASQRALRAAEGAAFSRAARARGGRAIGDGLIIDPGFQAAVDAALANVGRAQVLARADVAAVTTEQGVAIVAESITPDAAAGDRVADAAPSTRAMLDAARASGGGILADAVRRDDSGAASTLLRRVVWLPEAADALAIQQRLAPGWHAVARDGTIVVGEVATWIRPESRGLHLQPDAERHAAELAESETRASSALAAAEAATAAAGTARAQLAAAREREALAAAALRRAEEHDRDAAGRADGAAREAAWLAAQADRLKAEATRLRATVPDELGAIDERGARPSAADAPPTADRDAETAALRRRRDTLAAELASARAAWTDSERRRAHAAAQVSLAERQAAELARAAGDLAEREARLALEREELVRQLADSEHAATAAEHALDAAVAAASVQRDALRAAETAAATARDRVRIAQERSRLAERDELEARLALDALREGLLVELAGLGSLGLRHLRTLAGATTSEPPDTPDDAPPEALEEALAAASTRWTSAPPPADPPSAGRLASLRRRFHDLGAVNPFAAEEFEAVRTRLDGMEAQRSDLQAAIDHTRQLITELDTLVSDQFRRTFGALERAFDERFQQLFGGGYARLSLTDPDDLASTGIEITARPPGKKPQALNMLSGGERALTAVALLFAMLQVRPVPFCVLDEVDAALDEANIGRFTEALRDLARTTQCIVITHNRGTIEVADAMYGVTVGDDSVSRVISLRLDEATALADRSRSARPESIAVATDGGIA